MNGQTFKHKTQHKYSAIFTGKRKAEYRATVNPNSTIIENETLPVYSLERKSKIAGYFTIQNGKIIELKHLS